MPVRRRVVPITLGAAMLVVIVAAALSPNVAPVPAQSSCQYGDCSTAPTTPLWAWVAVGGVVFAAVLLTGLLLMRRRRRPPVSRWGPEAGAAGGATPPEEYPPSAGAGYDEGASPAPSAVPEYVEQPEDMGSAGAVIPPQPPVRPGPVAGGAVAGAAAGAAAGESSIDALMDELDRISGEILKKDQKAKGQAPPPEDESSQPPE